MVRAGAIVISNSDSYGSKRAVLERAGVVVVDTPREIPDAVLCRLPARAEVATRVPGEVSLMAA
jgi:succinyl-CoA synthetase alpha subunit